MKISSSQFCRRSERQRGHRLASLCLFQTGRMPINSIGSENFISEPIEAVKEPLRWVLFDNLAPRFGAVSPLFLRKKSAGHGVFDHNHIDYGQKPSCRGRCPQRPVSFGKHKSDYFATLKAPVLRRHFFVCPQIKATNRIISKR